MNAVAYVRSKFAQRPVATADTAFMGLVVQPFLSKWNGFAPWGAWLVVPLQLLSVTGMALLLFSTSGRLLLLMLVCSLVPYAFTWNVGGGGEWRFMMHTYPFYLAAAASAAVLAGRAIAGYLRRPDDVRAIPLRRTLQRSVAVAAVLAVVVLAYVALPWFVVRESIALGDATSVPNGERDLAFVAAGWSAPHTEGITVRVAVDERATVRLPLPEKRAYRLIIRMDPVEPVEGRRVAILLNGTLVARPRLTWNEQRVGSYAITVPEEAVDDEVNELAFVPETRIAAAEAGPRFSWLPPATRIGLRFWYVRVQP